MADFARAYRESAHFGIWAAETADDYGRRDALAQLAASVEQTTDRCLRHDRATLEALDYLERHSGCRVTIIKRFRTALAEPDPVQRRQQAGDAYAAICKAVAGQA